jgi:hypothetical protein
MADQRKTGIYHTLDGDFPAYVVPGADSMTMLRVTFDDGEKTVHPPTDSLDLVFTADGEERSERSASFFKNAAADRKRLQ